MAAYAGIGALYGVFAWVALAVLRPDMYFDGIDG